MWGGSHVLLAALALLAGSCVVANKYNITVGYLPCVIGELRDRQGLYISGALSMALEHINNSTEILPDVTLLVQWADTRCDTIITTRLLIDMICSGVVAFFGPEFRSHMAVVNAQSKNLPIICYKCSDYQNSTSPNFARLDPSVAKITKYIVSLLRYYKWNKFSILYKEEYKTAALSLENNAKMANMTLNHRRLIDDSWSQIIQDTKDRTRIYVFLGSTYDLVEMMNTMETLQLFARGEYMVIYLDMIPSWPKEPLYYLISEYQSICPKTAEFKKRAQSLLVVASAEPANSYANFERQVLEYNSKKPFQFPPNPFRDKSFSLYAAYLYDSVRLYATALHKLIEEETVQKNETLTYERLMSVARNGSRIVSKMIEITPFNSVTGSLIHLDERADANGDYNVLAYKQLNHSNCIHSMTPVGHFQETMQIFPAYKMYPHSPIDWPDDVKPEAEPYCGFFKDIC